MVTPNVTRGPNSLTSESFCLEFCQNTSIGAASGCLFVLHVETISWSSIKKLVVEVEYNLFPGII